MQKQTLVIDCRMINHSGIGTYIKNIVPIIIDQNLFSITCIGYADLKNFTWLQKCTFIQINAPIFSLLEQIQLYRNIPPCTIYWSPNWNNCVLPVKAKFRVVTIHDVYYLAYPKAFSLPKLIIAKSLIGFAVKKAAAIITVSNFSKSEILRLTTCPTNKINAIPLAVSDTFNQNNNPNPVNKPYLLFVGNVKAHKNLPRALSAFSKIKNQDTVFCIVGKKEGFITASENIDALIHNLGERVFFTGYVTDEQLKAYYANASAFIFPSLYEGFGLPILEAMKFFIPIIASSAASIPEVGGDAILYFNPLDEADITAKMEQVFDASYKINTQLYIQQLEKFSWEKTAQQHQNLFLEIISKS